MVKFVLCSMNRSIAAAICACAILAGCASAPVRPDAIVAAERAFAADGYATGIKSSFLKWSAPDAVMFSPGPVNAHETLSASPDADLTEPRPHLVWWPLYAGIAQSGDLGFTTGPYAIDDDRRGFYFTIWKQQPDGEWKWVLDAGLGVDAANEAPQGADVETMRASKRRSFSSAEAMKEIAELEAQIAAAAASDFPGAYDGFLAPDSRIHSARIAPAKSSSEHLSVLSVRPAALTLSLIGGGASQAGDLVWTYGEGRWTDGFGERTGYYVRLWRNDVEGWRLAFDEFIPVAPPPSDASPAE